MPNNASPVLHHRPFLFGFILCVTFVTRWSCFLTVSIELYELMNLCSHLMLNKVSKVRKQMSIYRERLREHI